MRYEVVIYDSGKIAVIDGIIELFSFNIDDIKTFIDVETIVEQYLEDRTEIKDLTYLIYETIVNKLKKIIF